MDRHRRGRRRTPGAHRARRGGDHRGRRRLLRHHRRPDPGQQPVRSPDAAQLHPRPWHPGHPGGVRGHVRLPDPGPRIDRHRAPRPVRARTCRSPWACCWCWATCWCSSTSSTTWPPRSSCPGSSPASPPTCARPSSWSCPPMGDAFVNGRDPEADAALAWAEPRGRGTGRHQRLPPVREPAPPGRGGRPATTRWWSSSTGPATSCRPAGRWPGCRPPPRCRFVTDELRRAHVTGPQRTLPQDLAFAIDQLVEIAIRALSPAVNDTFTALSCIDWLARRAGRRSPSAGSATAAPTATRTARCA